ncbi:MAG: Mur ligase family protein [Spirochaetota bacterium]
MSTYDAALSYLYNSLASFQRSGEKAVFFTLDNIKALCSIFANPHKSFPSIHIAGTNGKGSSAHLLAAILQTNGYRTGLFTSPHLKSFRERILVNNEQVSQEFIIAFVHKLKSQVGKLNLSFFEVTVCMAFVYFAEQNVDIAIIETGMGGSFDATNIIQPEVALITNTAKDHQQILGDELVDIARHKAGIIKKKLPS